MSGPSPHRRALALAVAVFLAPLPALAADEVFRDMKSKEALYLSDGPKVAYRGSRGGNPQPLILLGTEDGGRIIKVRFKKSPQVWTLTLAADRRSLTCEAKGEPRQSFELLTPEKLEALAAAEKGREHWVVVTSHENGGASYEPIVEVRGDVAPGATGVTISSFDADGALRSEFALARFRPGDSTFLFRAGKELGNMGLGYNRFLIKATFDDGKVAQAELGLSLHEYQGEMAKPVIYLYPPAVTRVGVRVEPAGGVTVSEPPYGDGWTVTAHPDGTLGTADGKTHRYLFWESALREPPQPLTEGFVVARGELEPFLDETLAELGLIAPEIADFKEFWLPKMGAGRWAAIRFLPRAEIDAAAPLTVTPRPDSVIRVLVDFRAHDAPPALAPQRLEPVQRRGFAVVEWGGLLYRR
jgi:hypothetical protein